jgi:hypothetical protein
MRRLSGTESGRGAARAVVWVVALVVMQGCAVMHDGMEFAQETLDPGVHGPKPVAAEEAAQLTDQQIDQRLDFITQRLEDNRTHAALWYYGFLAVNAGGMIAGATTAAFEDDADNQVYDILNSSLGLIGTGYLLVAPLPGRSGADPVNEMPSATHEDRAAQLAAAEDILYDAAGRAKQRTGWILHAGNVLINASAASVLLARESYDNAALLFFLNAAIGEAQILLTPWEPLTTWEDYRRLVDNGGVPPDPQVKWGIGPLPTGQGLALRAEF